MILKAIETAARALRYWETRQDVMSNNLANATTSGFKGERAFAQLLDGVVGPSAATRADLTGGALEATGRPLDVALEGDGFFVVRTEVGERLTRNGSFRMSADGTLTDARGNPVLGRSGQSIVLPPGEVSIDGQGTIHVDGSRVAEFQVEAVPDELVRAGTTYFDPGPDRRGVPEGDFAVHQGHLEESNVDPVSSLVEMIEIQRAYGALQRSVSVADDIQRSVANDIGRLE